MASRHSDASSRRHRAIERGAERSELLDVGRIIARNYARNRVHGLNKTQCGRCGRYYTPDEKEKHFKCAIVRPPTKPSAANSVSAKKESAEPKREVSIFRISVTLLSQGQRIRVRLGIWSCQHNSALLLFKDAKLLKSLATRLRRRFSSATFTVVSASAKLKKSRETYMLNSTLLDALFRRGRVN